MGNQERPAETVVTLDDDMKEQLGAFMRRLARCSPRQRWTVIYFLLKSLMGDDPEHEVSVVGPDGISYVNITPSKVWFERLMAQDTELSISEETLPELHEAIRLIDLSNGDPHVLEMHLSKMQQASMR